jgi:hypothetical protein
MRACSARDSDVLDRDHYFAAGYRDDAAVDPGSNPGLIDNAALLTALLSAAAVMIAAIALVMMLRGLAARTLEQRIATLGGVNQVGGSPSGLPRRLLFSIGEMVRGRTRLGMIASAGFRPRGVLPVLLGVKVVLVVAIPAAALVYGEAAGFHRPHADDDVPGVAGGADGS